MSSGAWPLAVPAVDAPSTARTCVSQSTVKTHAALAMMKLGARDRAQLVVFAYQAGLVRPAGPDEPATHRPRGVQG